MLINCNSNYESNVKFIDYTGCWPNLCRGILKLEIDGQEICFGNEQQYPKFWQTGGHINNYHAHTGEWIIDCEKLPEIYKKYAREIDHVFNENIPYGCCGGCS